MGETNTVRIEVPPNGVTAGTRIWLDGIELTDVVKIEISPLTIDGVLHVAVTYYAKGLVLEGGAEVERYEICPVCKERLLKP